jgi:hypothetical protein
MVCATAIVPSVAISYAAERRSCGVTLKGRGFEPQLIEVEKGKMLASSNDD